MQLTYLGTGAAEAIPAIFCRCALCEYAREHGGKDLRTRSGAMVDGVLKLDFPPDTNYHLRMYGLDITGLEHLLITHPHHDHYAYADLEYRLKGFGSLREDDPPLTVYGGKEVGELLQVAAHGRPLDGRLRFCHLTAFETVDIAGYLVTPLPSQHMEEAESFIYRIEKDGRSLLYAHDTGRFFDEVFDYLADKPTDLVSIDCTYMAGNNDRGHMGLPAVRAVAQTMRDRGAATAKTRFVVNHFSHNGGLTHAQLVQTAQGMEVSYDGLVLDV